MNDDPRRQEFDDEDEYEDFVTDAEDPRLDQFDDEFNERNDYTRKDYEEFAAWDVDDFEDEMRERGDFDVPAKRERDER